MSRLMIGVAVVALLAVVAVPAVAQWPAFDTTTIPLTVTVKPYGSIEVVNSTLDFELGPRDEMTGEWSEEVDFVHLSIDSNHEVQLEAAVSGEPQSPTGRYLFRDLEGNPTGASLELAMGPLWASTEEEFVDHAMEHGLPPTGVNPLVLFGPHFPLPPFTDQPLTLMAKLAVSPGGGPRQGTYSGEVTLTLSYWSPP